MNSTQKVKDTLAHRETGHVPQSIYLTGEGYDAYGDRLLEEYAAPQIMADYKAGILTKMQAVSLAIGNDILYVSAPWWDWHNVPDYFFSCEDTPEILPDTIGKGSYEDFFSKIAYLKEHYDAYLLVTVWGSHWEKAYFCRGIENFLADLAGSPEWAQQVLDLIIRKNLVMLENFITAPEISGVLLGSDWGTQNDLIMSPACWRTMIKHGEQQEYDLLKKYGKDVFIHSCGCILRIMGDLVEMGVDALNPVQPECMDIRKLKADYGDHITYFGGISTQRTLPYGTAEEVRKETEEVIRMMSVNGGYITAPSQEIQTDVPYENLKALIETARTYR